jgi:hypothetical protein
MEVRSAKCSANARQQLYDGALGRTESYVASVIESLRPDAKGKRRNLGGTTVTVSLEFPMSQKR